MVSTPLPAPCSTPNTAAAGAPHTASTATPSGCVSAASRAEINGCTRRRKPNSSKRATTCDGPTSAPTATAAASVAPHACISRGRCAAIAVLMNQVAANTNDSSTAVPVEPVAGAASSAAATACAGAAVVASGGAGGSIAFNGSPTTRCSTAQVKQAPRHPSSASSSVLSGQPTVLAKPAINVMPVMTLRESLPYRRTSAAK